MARTKIVVFGAGGFGREVAAMLQYSTLTEEFEIIGFIDDGLVEGTVVNGLSVLGTADYLLKASEPLAVTMGIGNPAIRRSVVGDLQVNEHLLWPNIIHPLARMHDPGNIRLGQGNIICDGTIITTNVVLGDFNIINLCCTVGHDAVLGSFCSLMPSVNVSGGAILEDEVYVGTGAKLIKATTLGKSSVIGAGAVVNTDIAAGSTAVGVPAKTLGK